MHGALPGKALRPALYIKCRVTRFADRTRSNACPAPAYQGKHLHRFSRSSLRTKINKKHNPFTLPTVFGSGRNHAEGRHSTGDLNENKTHPHRYHLDTGRHNRNIRPERLAVHRQRERSLSGVDATLVQSAPALTCDGLSTAGLLSPCDGRPVQQA